jgi:hypothetical protein
MEGLRDRHVGFLAHVEQGGGVIEAGVAAQARGDRQRLLRIIPGPQHDGVEDPFVQIVERRIGGESAHDVGAVAQQGVVQRQELRRGLADRQHAIGAGVVLRGVELAAELGEGLRAEFEFLLGHRGADQGLQPHGRLGRMQRGCQRHVEPVGLQDRIRIADSDDRQPPRRTGCLQAPRQAESLFAHAAQVDDRALDLQVGYRGNRGEAPSGGDRAPAKTVQPLGERPRQAVVPRDDQDSRLDA